MTIDKVTIDKETTLTYAPATYDFVVEEEPVRDATGRLTGEIRLVIRSLPSGERPGVVDG